MTENRKTPKLRFKGFTDAWEQRKLGEFTISYSGGTPSVGIKEYYNGQIPFIRSAEINSEITELFLTEEGLKNSSARLVDVGDILYALYGATSGEVGRARLKGAVNQAILVIKPHKEYDSEFLTNWLRKNKESIVETYLQGGQGNLSGTIVKELLVCSPSHTEQEEIGSFFYNLDSLITLHQRKLDRLKNIKKSMLDKMFPKDGEVVPEIRFKGFTDAWEQRKLSEVLSSYTDPVEIPRTGYERLGIRSHAKGTFHNFVPAGHELQTAQMHRVAADKFIVNITFGWEHAVAVTDENDAGKLVSHRFPQFSLSEELDPKFLKFIILDEDFRHHLWLASPGGAGRNRVLNINEMLQYEIMIPNVPEQRKIARMLIDLDNLITLHQRKLDKLKNIKKSMLDNMFV